MTTPTLTSFTHQLQIDISGEYYLQLPEGDAPYPLLLFLHGMHDQDKIFEMPVPPTLALSRSFPCAIASPRCTDTRWDIDAVLGVLDYLEQQYEIDPRRIYVTGISIGGLATWELAIRRRHKFAAIVPVCPSALPWQAFRISHIPTWVFHGAQDEIVPVTESETMVNALNSAGGDAKLTIYPDVGHGAWERAYATEELWEWLFAQELPIEE